MASPGGDQTAGLGPAGIQDVLRMEHFKDVKDLSFKTANPCVLGQLLISSVSSSVEWDSTYSAFIIELRRGISM